MKYTIIVSGKILSDLDKFAERHSISRIESVRRTFALLGISNEASKQNNKLAIIKKDSIELIVGA